MTKRITSGTTWIDPIETGVRERVRDWIEALIQAELETALGRLRYGRKEHPEQNPPLLTAIAVAVAPAA